MLNYHNGDALKNFRIIEQATTLLTTMSSRFSWRSLAPFLLLIACFVCLASGTSSFAAEKYVFILKWIGNPYWQALKQGVEDASKESGVSVTIMTPTNDQAKEEHLNLCQAATSQKPALIALGHGNNSDWITMLSRSAKARHKSSRH